jgi:DnaK suppressor protein
MKRATVRRHSRQRADYRQSLLEKRGEVLSSLGIKFDTLASMGRVAEEDQAQATHDEFISLQLNSLDYEQLKLVEEALERLESGDYGICTACGEPISVRRLQAIPWARYCIDCQNQLATLPAGAPEAEALAHATQPRW